MRNVNLRGVCEELGLDEVATLLSSGNVVFETGAEDGAELEARLEAAWPERLGFTSTTIIRRREELQRLVDLEPFGDRTHAPDSYLLVTFSKQRLDVHFEYPHRPAGRDYWVVGATDRELFTVSDTTSARGLDVMAWLERQLGKQISSRTWLTVNRILDKLAA